MIKGRSSPSVQASRTRAYALALWICIAETMRTSGRLPPIKAELGRTFGAHCWSTTRTLVNPAACKADATAGAGGNQGPVAEHEGPQPGAIVEGVDEEDRDVGAAGVALDLRLHLAIPPWSSIFVPVGSSGQFHRASFVVVKKAWSGQEEG